MDLSALRAELVTGEVPPRALSVAASQKCMESIVALAEKHRQLYDPDHPEVQPPWEIDTSEGSRERVAPEDADGRRQP